MIFCQNKMWEWLFVRINSKKYFFRQDSATYKRSYFAKFWTWMLHKFSIFFLIAAARKLSMFFLKNAYFSKYVTESIYLQTFSKDLVTALLKQFERKFFREISNSLRDENWKYICSKSVLSSEYLLLNSREAHSALYLHFLINKYLEALLEVPRQKRKNVEVSKVAPQKTFMHIRFYTTSRHTPGSLKCFLKLRQF